MQSHTVIFGYTETENRVTDLKNVFFVKKLALDTLSGHKQR